MEIDPQNIYEHEYKCKIWLIKCFEKANQCGFSHSRWLYLPSNMAWEKPYPETTGYLIENFIKFNYSNPNDLLIAKKSIDWLLSIQSSDGWYYSGVETKKISAFNTAQILGGLKCYFDTIDPSNKIGNYIKISKNVLINQILPSGIWSKGLYVKNYFSSYYTRAIWQILKMELSELEKEKVLKSLYTLFNYRDNDCYFKKASFHPSKNSLSHTMGYTLEGFWESSILLGDNLMNSIILEMLEKIAHEILIKGQLWSEISDKGLKQYSYRCITGEAQFTSLLYKAFNQSNLTLYKSAADILMYNLIKIQNRSNNKDIDGSFPASKPIYSKYFPFRLVNWTSKFFLDACYQFKIYYLKEEVN